MSDIDLTEAKAVAAKQIRAKQSSEVHNQIRLARYWDEGLTATDDMEACQRQADAAITAAAPLIERAVREQVARDLEAYGDATWDLVDSNNGARLAFAEMARIARGDS